ncbi:N-glycosylase/DNA lyase [Candidatus Woesearchaeota archaeon]|nr:N-glycosylase/DNA lyase [Candidatus Woesearchaeota archaeon]MBW3005449.1 N-glycosylase/DNA lyase [Candidatus Woesearchaeota archaeon]
MKLFESIKELRNSPVKLTVNKRLKEFEALGKKNTKQWFSELCFCILTANSKAITALKIQKELGAKGFCSYCFKDIRNAIKRNKHRFHNNKAKYITEARCHVDIKQKLKNMKDTEARAWLVKNIKGLGYKESSHFLRNVGFKNLAILDRHILNLMNEKKTLNKKSYLDIEKKFLKLAKKSDMSPAELDLYMWYMKTGKVLK